jgi:hypothetical protein
MDRLLKNAKSDNPPLSPQELISLFHDLKSSGTLKGKKGDTFGTLDQITQQENAPTDDFISENIAHVKSAGEFQEKSEFIEEIPVPEIPVNCECINHWEKVEKDTIIHASAKKVYEILFGSESANFWMTLDKKRGITSKY